MFAVCHFCLQLAAFYSFADLFLVFLAMPLWKCQTAWLICCVFKIQVNFRTNEMVRIITVTFTDHCSYTSWWKLLWTNVLALNPGDVNLFFLQGQ